MWLTMIRARNVCKCHYITGNRIPQGYVGAATVEVMTVATSDLRERASPRYVKKYALTHESREPWAIELLCKSETTDLSQGQVTSPSQDT